MFCKCQPNQTIDVVGLCDVSKIDLSVNNAWTQISIPEVFTIPPVKPDIEQIEKVFVNVKILSKRVVETPKGSGPNQEGTTLTGFKLIIEGVLDQKIIYTADKPTQPVHSAEFCFPFSAFIVLPLGTTVTDDFCVDACIEDVFIKVINPRKFFKNVTLLLNARKVTTC